VTDAWLETEAPEQLKKQRVNSLKGQGLEALLRYVTGRDFETTLSDVSDAVDPSELEEYYRAKRMFRVKSSDNEVDLLFRKTSQKGIADFRFTFDPNSLSEDKSFTLYQSAATQEKFLRYRKCNHCGHIFPPVFCKDCGGGAIVENSELITGMISKARKRKRETDSSSGKTHDQFLKKIREIKRSKWNDIQWDSGFEWCICDRKGRSPNKETHFYEQKNIKKCKKCNKGHYQMLRSSFSTNMVPVQSGLSPDELTDSLLELDYIKRVSVESLNRLDLWNYEGDLYVTEAKNMEKSGLGLGAIVQVCYYLRALSQVTDKAKDATIVYNGECSDSVERARQEFNNLFGFNIQTQSLRDWCDQNEFYFEEIVVGTKEKVSKPDLRNSSSGRYWSRIVESDDAVASPKLRLKVEPE